MYYNSTENQIANTGRKFISTLNNKLTGVPNFWLTRVDYDCRTYVRDDYSIILDINDVEGYAEMNGISIDAATKLLLSHEIFHILLGHFSDKYKDYDKNLLNIAGDLEINSYLGIEHPGIMASDYGWSALLSTDVYYQKLLELMEENKREIEISDLFGNLSDFASGNNGKQENANTNGDAEQNITVSIYDINGNKVDEISDEDDSSNDNDNTSNIDDDDTDENEFNDMIERNYGIDIPEDVIINTGTSDYLEENNTTINVGCSIDALFNAKKVLKEVAKSCMNEYKNYSLDGLDKIMSKLIRTENEKAIVPHTRKPTYYKLNNRRQSGDFILPGKKLEGGATKKKFDRSLTVFIDVSGSTCGTIANNLSKVAYKLYEQGATIVYYTSQIIDVIKPNQAFKKCPAGGGTEIKEVVKDYMEKYGKLERVYVFTDGQDNFTQMNEVCDKYKIFYIGYKYIQNTYQRKLSCWEKFSDKKPQKSRWE